MEQLAGRQGEYVMMRCLSPSCDRFYKQCRVPYPRLDTGEINLTAISPVVRCDMQNQANLFKSTQNVERFNSSLSPTASKVKGVLPPMTRMLGDDAVTFASLIADIRTNLVILANLNNGRVSFEERDVEAMFHASMRKARTVFANRNRESPDMGATPKHHLMDGIGKRRANHRAGPSPPARDDALNLAA